jgi:hypothetical protein
VRGEERRRRTYECASRMRPYQPVRIASRTKPGMSWIFQPFHELCPVGFYRFHTEIESQGNRLVEHSSAIN